MIRIIAPMLMVLILTSCRSFQAHPWTRDVKFDDSSVDFILSKDLSHVKADKEELAIGKLESRSFVALSKNEYEEMAGKPRPLGSGETAYLVRGVTWSNPPLFSIVAFNRKDGVLYVIQYTFSGEIYIPGKYKSVPRPVIVILQEHVSQVLPGAVWGGDRIMAWSQSRHAWNESDERGASADEDKHRR